MKRLALTLALSALWISPAAAQKKPEKSLYQRAGGYDAIAAVVDNLLPRLVGDPQLAPFFKGHSIDSQKKTRQLVVNLVCEAAGGPCFYTGRNLKTAHEGLGIDEGHWAALMKHFKATLDHNKVPAKEQEELVAIISRLRPDIVTGK